MELKIKNKIILVFALIAFCFQLFLKVDAIDIMGDIGLKSTSNMLQNPTPKNFLVFIQDKETYTRVRLKEAPTKEEADEIFMHFLDSVLEVSRLLIKFIDFNDLENLVSIKEVYPRRYVVSDIGIKRLKSSNGVFYVFVNPKTNLYSFQFSAEFVEFNTNYKYLYRQYAKYLSNSWKEYLFLNDKLKAEYAVDGTVYNVSKNELGNWIIAWRAFLNKYPKFPYKNDIEQSIAQYTSELIFDFYNFDFDTHTITPESKLAYESFLAKADKNTSEYRLIKICYDELKRNNFKETLKFHKYLYDWNMKHKCFGEKINLYRYYRKIGRVE